MTEDPRQHDQQLIASVLQPTSLQDARQRYFMIPEVRVEIGRRLGLNSTEQILTDRELTRLVITAKENTLQKLHELGIASFDEYDEIYTALRTREDADIRLLRVFGEKVKRLRTEMRNSYQVVSTKSQFTNARGEYVPERAEKHRQWINEALSGVEDHDDPDDPPTLLIIGGLPGGGKTSARELLRESVNGGCVATDPDGLRHHIFPGYDGNNQIQTLQTQDEAFDVSDAILEASRGTVIEGPDGQKIRKGRKNAIIEGTMRDKAFLIPEIKKFVEAGYKIQLAWVHKDPEECFETATVYRERGVPLDLLMTALEYGWQNFWDLSQMPEVAGSMVLLNEARNVRVVYDANQGKALEADTDALLKIWDINRRFARKEFA